MRGRGGCFSFQWLLCLQRSGLKEIDMKREGLVKGRCSSLCKVNTNSSFDQCRKCDDEESIAEIFKRQHQQGLGDRLNMEKWGEAAQDNFRGSVLTSYTDIFRTRFIDGKWHHMTEWDCLGREVEGNRRDKGRGAENSNMQCLVEEIRPTRWKRKKINGN